MWKNNFKLKKQYHKYKLTGISRKESILNQGHFGIKVTQNGFLSYKIIKAFFNFLKKRIKKMGKIWLNITPNMIFTKKPLETRMGKGKGGFNFFGVLVKKGKIILEVEVYSFTIENLTTLLKKIFHKINLKIQIVKFKI